MLAYQKYDSKFCKHTEKAKTQQKSQKDSHKVGNMTAKQTNKENQHSQNNSKLKNANNENMAATSETPQKILKNQKHKSKVKSVRVNSET